MRESSPIDIIIVTSDEPWCDIWHTQLHYAYQLSKRTRVIFLGPPKPWKLSNLWRFQQEKQVINERLDVITYLNFIPAGIGGISLWINDHINYLLLKFRVIKNSSHMGGIIWHFDPHRSYYIFQMNRNFRHLFHVIDPIAECNLDLKLARMADVIVVTSPKFIEHYRNLNNHVIQIGQGVDLDFYRNFSRNHAYIENEAADSILLLGTISDQIHFDLLIKIAEKFPGRLVLIGPDKTISERGKRLFKELLAVRGVKWLGPMPPEKFISHLFACRVGIIAYDDDVNYKNNLRSPLKVISYLACGKAIISNVDCEIPLLDGKAFFMADSDLSFINLIEKAYNNELQFSNTDVNVFLNSIDYSIMLSRIFNELNIPLPSLK